MGRELRKPPSLPQRAMIVLLYGRHSWLRRAWTSGGQTILCPIKKLAEAACTSTAKLHGALDLAMQMQLISNYEWSGFGLIVTINHPVGYVPFLREGDSPEAIDVPARNI
jgi:hypothetical protein